MTPRTAALRMPLPTAAVGPAAAGSFAPAVWRLQRAGRGRAGVVMPAGMAAEDRAQ